MTRAQIQLVKSAKHCACNALQWQHAGFPAVAKLYWSKVHDTMKQARQIK